MTTLSQPSTVTALESKKAPSASPLPRYSRHAEQTHFSLLNPHTVTETISIHLQPVTWRSFQLPAVIDFSEKKSGNNHLN
ncbi:hypothetical protein CIP107577_00459 [Corynebacterium diphtheriae]|nr:hypothetical protein B11Q_00474 [Corynebacterium diphtheriae]CAB0587102.1 hypothetical protein CIP107559_00555 [Corynebacterium diphtheriae]CAB0587235.1 hypothetical protein CIP107552_00582 [Corynebacterium diphtheriae]CAB0633465.1 hypothetical protein CIP107577_00459 [Corynebacterium diphtheriae]CAB0737910.1 hypothetical protein FRC0137_00502 [Corynebacterium diphtheriae]